MKISDDLPPRGIRIGSSKAAGEDKGVPVHTGSPGHTQGSKERVSLSHRAADNKKIRAIIEKTPEVRAEKVALLKKKIADGDYAVRGKDISDKLLREFLLEDLLKKED